MFMAHCIYFLRRVSAGLTRLDISVSMAEAVVHMHANITTTNLYLLRWSCLRGELTKRYLHTY